MCLHISRGFATRPREFNMVRDESYIILESTFYIILIRIIFCCRYISVWMLTVVTLRCQVSISCLQHCARDNSQTA